MDGDERHAAEVIIAFGLEKANSVMTRGVLGDDDADPNDADKKSANLLARKEETRFRAIAARLNYRVHDRPDIRGCRVQLKKTSRDSSE